MNYKESKQILEEIKKAKRILLNCHRGPDPDAIGSALAMYRVLKQMDKEVDIICPSEKLYEDCSYLSDYEKIKKEIDFSKFNFSDFDLFITMDSSSWDMVSYDPNIPLPDIRIIALDHHHTNKHFGLINLVDEKVAATCELLYLIFDDWGVKIDKNIATALLTGVIGDTGIFKYPNTTSQTFNVSFELISKGADKELIIARVYRSIGFNLVKFWGEALNRVKFEKKHKFVYSAVPYEVYEKLDKPDNAKESAVDLFGQIIKGTEFGFMALETEKDKLSISFRARLNFDTSLIATELGGGGHPAASGAKVEGLSFKKAVEKVLNIARKIAKENAKQ